MDDKLLIAADAIQQYVWSRPGPNQNAIGLELQSMASRLLEISYRKADSLKCHLEEKLAERQDLPHTHQH